MAKMIKSNQGLMGSDTSPRLTRGASSPLGATPCREGVNFSVFSKHATGIELLLFDHVDAEAVRGIRMDPVADQTYRAVARSVVVLFREIGGGGTPTHMDAR